MEGGVIRRKNRRSLIILTVLMCLVAVAILVIAVIMFSMIISRKEDEDDAEVSNLGLSVEGKRVRCNFQKCLNLRSRSLKDYYAPVYAIPGSFFYCYHLFYSNDTIISSRKNIIT